MTRNDISKLVCFFGFLAGVGMATCGVVLVYLLIAIARLVR